MVFVPPKKDRIVEFILWTTKDQNTNTTDQYFLTIYFSSLHTAYRSHKIRAELFRIYNGYYYAQWEKPKASRLQLEKEGFR